MKNNVFEFYQKLGWKNKNNISYDSILFEDLRECAKNYISKTRKRILQFIPKKGEKILDFASGPIQYSEYKLYSKHFKYRYCVDFSLEAIKKAKKVLKKHGKYFCTDFLKKKFKENYFDCSISLHTIYHLDKNVQKKAVNKLLNITKIGSSVIILYSNPNNIFYYIKKIINYKSKKSKLYFFCHKNTWWKQFSRRAIVKIYPQRSFSSQHQKILFPNNFLGKFMFQILFKLEDLFPNFFSTYFQYILVVLKKKY